MIGFVIWCDADERQAVVWCEDQGDLAYCSAGRLEPGDFGRFQPGDMVRFDVRVEGALRRASNIALVSRAQGAHLPGQLQAATANPPQRAGAKIVDFPGQRREVPAVRPLARRQS